MAQKGGGTFVASSSVGRSEVEERRKGGIIADGQNPEECGPSLELEVHCARAHLPSRLNPVNAALLRREVWPMNRTRGLLCTVPCPVRLKSRSDGDSELALHAPGAASASLFEFTDLGGSTLVQ